MITQLFPPKLKQYLEPFGGSGSILLHQTFSESRLDIYNDLNGDLVNLFRCVRDMPLQLMRELGFLPLHSRDEFELLKNLVAHEQSFFENLHAEMEVASNPAYFTPEQSAELMSVLRQKRKLFDVRRAAASVYLSRGSFSGTTTSFGVKTLVMKRFLHLIKDASERLQGVVIEHKDALKLIRERACENGLIYCDPPYKNTERMYAIPFERKRHIRLWQVLSSSKGYWVVSYNDSDFVRQLYRDYYILSFERDHPMSKKKGARYQELLICNYDPRPYMETQISMFASDPLDAVEKFKPVLINIPANRKENAA